MFSGLGASNAVSRFAVGDVVVISGYSTLGSQAMNTFGISPFKGTVLALLYTSAASGYVQVKYRIRREGSVETVDAIFYPPDNTNALTGWWVQPLTPEFENYQIQLTNQKAWIASLKQTGFTHQAIIYIDNKLASGTLATPSEIDSVRTIFINTSSTSPTSVGVSVVVGISEQNGLPHPIIGIVGGVSPSGNYVAQVGTSYYEFKSGTWVSSTSDLEARIADLQTKLNTAKSALAAAEARLVYLQNKAQALGILIIKVLPQGTPV